MSGRRRATGAAIVAAAVAVGTAAPVVTAGAATPSPAATAVLGEGGLALEVDGVERRGGELRVIVTVANHTDEGVSTSALQSRSEFGVPTVWLEAIDPRTGRTGRPADGQQAGIPVELAPDEAFSVVVAVQDPGGDRVDVVPWLFHPVLGVPVTGEDAGAPADDVAQLQPRNRAVQPRAEVGAAEVRDEEVALDADVLFPFDSAELSPEADAALDTVAESLAGEESLSVVGHTDGQGGEEYNLQLSRERAEAVAAALAQRLGPGVELRVEGRGQSEPVAPEVDESGAPYPEGAARNRRVEVTAVG